MSILTRVFRRTPSLRQRVAFTSAIAGAIVVVIAGTVVWFGITDAWNERLDRRLDEKHHDDRILIIAPNTTVIKGLNARTVQAAAIEDDLTSAVDRIVADQRIAAHRAVKVLRLPATTRADEAPYSPLTSFFGAMAR